MATRHPPHAQCAFLATAALIIFAAFAPTTAQQMDRAGAAPAAPAGETGQAAPQPSGDQTGQATQPDEGAPARAPAPGCRMQENKKLDLIV
jgi:hypothetical protein